MVPKLVSYTDSTFKSLKMRNYRLYFMGQGISQTGNWTQTIAQTWLVLQLTHSGTDVGLLVAVQFLPILLFGPFGGVIADRFPKRRIMYCTQTSAMILALIMAILVQTHSVELWMIYVLAGLLGLTTTIDNPARQSFVVEMVGKDNLTNAVSLNSVLVNMARVVGPTIAGLLIANVGISACFFINSASFLAVLLCLYLMDGSLLYATKHSTKIKGQLRQGFRYIMATPVIRNIIFMLFIIGSFSYEFQVVLPLFAKRTFHGDAGTYALLFAALSFGSILGGLLVANSRSHSPRLIAGSAVLFGVFMLLSSVSPTLLIATIMLAGVGFGSILFSSLVNSALQLESSQEMRGRVMAFWSVGFLGTTPIGGPIIGWLCDHTNPRAGLAVGGAAAIVAAVVGIVLPTKNKQPSSTVSETN